MGGFLREEEKFWFEIKILLLKCGEVDDDVGDVKKRLEIFVTEDNLLFLSFISSKSSKNNKKK